MKSKFYEVMTIFTQRFNICSPKFWGTTVFFFPPGYPLTNTVNDGRVVLILLLQLQTCRLLKLNEPEVNLSDRAKSV